MDKHSISDKRDRARVLRERLGQAITQAGMSHSDLARRVGADRSTISSLLTTQHPRLPNAQILAECARALGTSTDWLLGLTDRPEQTAALVANAAQLTKAPRALVDEQIFAWHQETDGYKIRHVPAGLPDMLKTDAMLRWEYSPSLGRTADQAIGASNDRLDWMRASASDYEIAMPIHDLRAFARGEGYYTGIPVDMRKAQLTNMAQVYDQLYPRLRVFLFNARKLYSAPLTIFGPLQAVIYLGSNYIGFRDKDRVQALTRHFDGLIRESDTASREVPTILAKLAQELDETPSDPF